MPSVPVAPIEPWICGSAELVMEMSSVAISAPSAPPITAIQSVTEAFGSVTGAATSPAAVTRREQL